MRDAVGAAVLTTVLGLGAYACVFSKTTSNFEETSATTGDMSTGGANFDRNALLSGLATNVVVPTYAEFVDAAERLETTTATHADTLAPADRDAARTAWREAMDIWQRAEIFQFGPAGQSGATPGGSDIRDEIYSWTLVNRCATDQHVVSRDFANLDAFEMQLVNVRGLDALEYLLFVDGPNNSCAPQVPINANGSWDALDDLEQRRADYAKALASLVLRQAQRLHDAWRASGGGFAEALETAGRGSTAYDSPQTALNAVSDAMFYLEAKTKDVKLAVPTGLSPDCAGDTCPNELELRFSGHSKEAVRQNLRGFELAYTGGDEDGALGFDDWLLALGAGDLDEQMRARLAEAYAAVDAVEEDSLAAALADDPQSVEAIYFALKGVADLLKSDFITTLDLELPQAVDGDND